MLKIGPLTTQTARHLLPVESYNNTNHSNRGLNLTNLDHVQVASVSICFMSLLYDSLTSCANNFVVCYLLLLPLFVVVVVVVVTI